MIVVPAADFFCREYLAVQEQVLIKGIGRRVHVITHSFPALALRPTLRIASQVQALPGQFGFSVVWIKAVVTGNACAAVNTGPMGRVYKNPFPGQLLGILAHLVYEGFFQLGGVEIEAR